MDAGPEDPRPLLWPLYTIDFEASSLDDGTYPIEVGIARWLSPDSPIEGWSTLICPTANWERHGSWSSGSEKVHGIAREELATGLSPSDAMRRLNAIIGANTAYCDGGDFDRHWLGMVQHAGGRAATFDIGNFDDLKLKLPHGGHFRLQTWLNDSPPPHRARQDAERLMKALARGLGRTYGKAADIDQEADQKTITGRG